MPLITRDNPDYHLGHFLIECLKRRPEAIFQIDAATDMQESNESVLQRSVRLARCFRRLGLRPGDVLALGGRNHLDLHIPYYAALMNGLPIAGVDPLFKYDEIKTFFKIARPKVAFCQKEDCEDYKEAARTLGLDTIVFTFDGDNSMNKILEDNDDDAPIDDFEPTIFDLDKVYAFLISTGGTSGTIKLAAFKHNIWFDKVLISMAPILSKLGEGEKDENKMGLFLSPAHWYSSFYSALAMLVQNRTKLQTSAPAMTEHVIDIINKYRPVTAIMSPSVVTSILRHEKECDFTCFEALPLGGGNINKDFLIKLRELTRDPTVAFQSYGQTENLGLVFIPNPLGPLGNCGKRMSSVLVKLVDPETGKEITEANTTGELWTKTACFSEYYNSPEETAMVFSEDGYYKTGDLLYRDEEDNFFFVERLKMLIKYRNYHIVPPELEELILTHPGVQEVSVTGVPHPEDGEWAVACVVIQKGAKVTAKQIEDLVADKLSDSKRLRGGVIFMDELPYTSTGKLARGKLRQMVIELKNKN
ncbi:hypothetical protein K1T71_011401 [Dendrolimus kikuchii]|uniref:Uncharacterized protein n=1 Tax=Dendrolimus kikuchii TaxID=765133 RepID=A0ACC1CNN6_9NEOP|nr:hypothetical protein K1T71_011401 [Dendrolimus kikuchii]